MGDTREFTNFYLPSVFFFDVDSAFTSACPAGWAGGEGNMLAEASVIAGLSAAASPFCESTRLYQDNPSPKTVRIATNKPEKIAKLSSPWPNRASPLGGLGDFRFSRKAW